MTILIPYDRRHEAFCPWCNSLGTEYHPDLRWGRCHDCGKDWAFGPHRRPSYGEIPDTPSVIGSPSRRRYLIERARREQP